jgi:hypothetical protein
MIEVQALSLAVLWVRWLVGRLALLLVVPVVLLVICYEREHHPSILARLLGASFILPHPIMIRGFGTVAIGFTDPIPITVIGPEHTEAGDWSEWALAAGVVVANGEGALNTATVVGVLISFIVTEAFYWETAPRYSFEIMKALMARSSGSYQ